MLDYFSIFTRGGLVLWTFQLTALKGAPIDALIQTCLLQERSGESSFQYNKNAAAYTLKWTFQNELGLVFVSVYQRALQLLYVDELLQSVKDAFSGIYSPKKTVYTDFDTTFQQLLREAEEYGKEMRRPKQITEFTKTKKGQSVQRQSAGGSRSSQKQDDKGDGEGADDSDGKAFTNGNGTTSAASETEGSESEVMNGGGKGQDAFDFSKLRHRKKSKVPLPEKKTGMIKSNGEMKAEDSKKKVKQMRKWDDSPAPAARDYSDQKEPEIKGLDVKKESKSLMDAEDVVIGDDEDEEEDEEDDEEENESDDNGAVSSGSRKGLSNETASKRTGWFSAMFHSFAGKAALEKADLKPALKALKERLMNKNVAEEIAEKLCESVATSLVGRKHASFTRMSSTVKAAMEEALQRILTPKRSIDILRDVHAAKEQGRPYVITFVGVNGVGKSTNLAKVAYWLLQHDVKVMLAACDTFRAGAVEQLRTHARRLQVELFEKGYEKDPAAVAKDAIREAVRTKQDVVLVDTAGRMQDNEPLMRALSKLITTNEPDLVLFVGEALVGNDAVDQLSKFNQRLADLSPTPDVHAIDGILLTKFDTIDDKVGAALSMVYISGAPIIFVGCGQTYTDLRKLNVKQIISALLK
eukprot:jgi/Mesen1/2445/ME000158S01643